MRTLVPRDPHLAEMCQPRSLSSSLHPHVFQPPSLTPRFLQHDTFHLPRENPWVLTSLTQGSEKFLGPKDTVTRAAQFLGTQDLEVKERWYWEPLLKESSACKISLPLCADRPWQPPCPGQAAQLGSPGSPLEGRKSGISKTHYTQRETQNLHVRSTGFS